MQSLALLVATWKERRHNAGRPRWNNPPAFPPPPCWQLLLETILPCPRHKRRTRGKQVFQFCATLALTESKTPCPPIVFDLEFAAIMALQHQQATKITSPTRKSRHSNRQTSPTKFFFLSDLSLCMASYGLQPTVVVFHPLPPFRLSPYIVNV